MSRAVTVAVSRAVTMSTAVATIVFSTNDVLGDEVEAAGVTISTFLIGELFLACLTRLGIVLLQFYCNSHNIQKPEFPILTLRLLSY